jgi:hypothetical protein
MPSRAVALALLFAAAAGFIAFLVMEVPVAAPLPGGHVLWFCPLAAPPLPHGEALRHWSLSVLGAGMVLCVDAVTVAVWLRLRRRPRPAADPEGAHPDPLRLERVPARAAWISAAASLTLLAAGTVQGYAMWVTVGMVLLPWLPLVVVEAAWKYEHYGLWAIFGVVVLLQIGHMGEHTVQVVQLLLYDGQLARSHGIFGQLDFETVHFFWDSSIWLCLCLVLPRFGSGNRWLWVAFTAASVHQVEHIYLFWVYRADPNFYIHGGLAGIMGNGGLIGSPLARPYLHFTYNLLVVVPMVLAFWDQSRHVTARVQPRHRRRAVALLQPGSSS